jgi:CRP-like cAMP-binding protein
MHDALTLLNEFDQDHVEWIFNTGLPQLFEPNAPIIREGVEPEALYIIMEGLVGIFVASMGDMCIARLGPGELLGDISFLEKIPASASVIAIENTNVLIIPRKDLQSKLTHDPGFGARLFKALAIISNRRLRMRERAFGRVLQERDHGGSVAMPMWRKISDRMDEFKSLMQNADREALRNENTVPQEVANGAKTCFVELNKAVHEAIDDDSPENMHINDEVGTSLQRELLPYLLLSRTAERLYAKPRGSTVDYLTVKWIYENKPKGVGRIGPLLDRCFLELPMLTSVRNQPKFIANEIRKAIENKKDSRLRITCFGCGPAKEILDVFMELHEPSCLHVTLIDIDIQALASVSEQLDKMKLAGCVKMYNANLVYLATNRQELDVSDQDLVYSTGIANYFDDKIVVSLMNYLHTILRPGGRVLLGNFCTGNPNRAFMKYVLNWHIFHRSEEDMRRLFFSSSFKRECTEIAFEDEGISLFACCIR